MITYSPDSLRAAMEAKKIDKDSLAMLLRSLTGRRTTATHIHRYLSGVEPGIVYATALATALNLKSAEELTNGRKNRVPRKP